MYFAVKVTIFLSEKFEIESLYNLFIYYLFVKISIRTDTITTIPIVNKHFNIKHAMNFY